LTAALAWAQHRGGDRLVLQGLKPEMLAHLRSLSPADIARALPVFPTEVLTHDGMPGALQATSGRYDVSENEVGFTPRYPFLAGTSYTMFVSDEDALVIKRPAVGGSPSTTVVGVHPTATVLPRNALRFYIRFSAPMTYGVAARHVHLERADTGETLVGVFSPMDPELWDTERQRLTVLLDPARIKRGLAPHREAGYPLTEGVGLTLAVERGFLDAAGRPLIADYRRSYDVGPASRTHIDPADWALRLPKVGGRLPLIVVFDRPLDRALLDHCLMVTRPNGVAVGGITGVPPGEESWSFVPDSGWEQGAYCLLVDPVLEDLAGNSLIRVFDRDLETPEHEPRVATTVSIPFVI
jgi:hypothetical protein